MNVKLRAGVSGVRCLACGGVDSFVHVVGLFVFRSAALLIRIQGMLTLVLLLIHLEPEGVCLHSVTCKYETECGSLSSLFGLLLCDLCAEAGEEVTPGSDSGSESLIFGLFTVAEASG